MKVIHLPENGTSFIGYEVDGKTIDFDDGELSFRVDKKERDYEVVIDICQDYTGGLVMGADAGDRYVAQLLIPEREYEDIENTENGEAVTERKAVPFSMDRCTLTLWEMEE